MFFISESLFMIKYFKQFFAKNKHPQKNKKTKKNEVELLKSELDGRYWSKLPKRRNGTEILKSDLDGRYWSPKHKRARKGEMEMLKSELGNFWYPQNQMVKMENDIYKMV